MKKLLLLLLTFTCFILSPMYAQIDDRSKSIYESQTGMTTVDTNFRSNEMVLDAAGIESKARLINLRFDKNKGIIRLDGTELIEDDAQASGVLEGYNIRLL